MTKQESPLDELVAAAWPAEIEARQDRWILRATRGVTRRANSTLIVGEPDDLDAAIVAAEHFAAVHQIPPVFLASDRLVTDRVRGALVERGYVGSARTAVLVADIATVAFDEPCEGFRVDVADGPSAEWLDSYTSVEHRMASETADVVLREHLLGPSLDRSFVSVVNGRPGADSIVSVGTVSVGQVVVCNGRASIQCLATRPEGRRLGAGRTVVRRLAAEAQRMGATELAAAVMVGNEASRSLFDREGYALSHHYEYLVRPRD